MSRVRAARNTFGFRSELGPFESTFEGWRSRMPFAFSSALPIREGREKANWSYRLLDLEASPVNGDGSVVLESAEESLGIRVVVADARTTDR